MKNLKKHSSSIMRHFSLSKTKRAFIERFSSRSDVESSLKMVTPFEIDNFFFKENSASIAEQDTYLHHIVKFSLQGTMDHSQYLSMARCIHIMDDQVLKNNMHIHEVFKVLDTFCLANFRFMSSKEIILYV